MHHDLALLIHHRVGVVALHDPVARLHLRRLIVRHVALDLRALLAQALGFFGEELVNAIGFALELVDALTLGLPAVTALAVDLPVFLHRSLHQLAQLVLLFGQLRPRAAPLLARVRGQLHPVDGKVRSAQEPFLRTNQQHLGEQVCQKSSFHP